MKYSKITVITVSYNAEETIKETIESVLNQTYNNIEYIIIDGASKDGTVDIIKDYEEKAKENGIAYKWISEPDNGIYDAMNKGINMAEGVWINFMNSGDYFSENNVLENFTDKIAEDTEIVYGDSQVKKQNGEIYAMKACKPLKFLWKGPIFRHGAMLIKADIHKKRLYLLNKEYKISADFDFIYWCYKNNKIFQYINSNFLVFLEEGISNNIEKNLIDNCLISSKYEKSKLIILYYFYKTEVIKICKNILIRSLIKKLKRIKYMMSMFIKHYIPNYFISYIPSYFIRNLYYRNILKIEIGKKSTIHMGTFITGNKISLGDHSTVGRRSYLDGRGRIKIGNSVSISPDVQIITAGHIINSASFKDVIKEVTIEDFVWIGTCAIILPGVKIGRGAVIASGAVVTKNIEENHVVAGNPAKFIKLRKDDYNYKCDWFLPFD